MERISKTVTSSGLVETVDFDGENLIRSYTQDITRALEAAQAVRNDDDAWKTGVKNNRVHAAHIPDGVVHELLKIGINVYTHPWPDIRAGLKKLNREACLTTRKNV
jgi:hypothetical protein